MNEYSDSFSIDNGKKTKINILLGDISARGGIERVSISLANALAEKYSVEITSLYQSRPSLSFKLADNVRHRVLDSGPEESMYNRKRAIIPGVFFDFRYIWRKKRKLSSIAYSYSVTITCDTKMTLLAKMSGCKNIIAIEHFEYDAINSLLKLLRRFIYRTISAVVTLTNEDKDKYFWMKGKRHEVIPNIAEFPICSLLDHKKENIVLAIGRFVEQKGFDLLLNAWSMLPDNKWELKIIGDGPCREQLKELIRKNNMKNVSLEPFRENIQSDYHKARIFVLSSRYEGLGMVLIEALAHGLACVSFNCPAGPKTILNKNNGILVEAENVEELSAALMKLMSNDKLRLEYSARAPDSIQEYTKIEVLTRWVKLIERVVV